MAAPVTVQIHGLRELEKSLKALPIALGNKVIFRALHDGARLIVAQAKANVPSDIPNFSGVINASVTGKRKRGGQARTIHTPSSLLRGNIIQRSLGRNNHGFGFVDDRYGHTVVVGVRSHGYRRYGRRLRWNRPGSSPSWWWWVEFGTSRYRAHPFLRPAFEGKKFQAAQEIKASIRRGLEVIAQDVARAYGLRRAA